MLFPDDEDVYRLWSVSYNQIYNANAIIEGVDKSVSLVEPLRSQIYGVKPLFIRSLLHYYLVNLFGDIPYVSGTDYLINQRRSRTPADTVYAHILTDLKKAETLLGLKIILRTVGKFVQTNQLSEH